MYRTLALSSEFYNFSILQFFPRLKGIIVTDKCPNNKVLILHKKDQNTLQAKMFMIIFKLVDPLALFSKDHTTNKEREYLQT